MSVDQSGEFVKPQTLTRDAFLGGKLEIAQPDKGFRAGLDSVLLGASVSEKSTKVLDLGCGVGTAALVALAHNPRTCVTGVDIREDMLAVARINIEANGFSDRASVGKLDVAGPPAARQAAGLQQDHFTSVIANPPFFDAAEGTRAPEASRDRARHMHAGDIEKWVRAAAALAAPRGEAIFIYRAEGLPELLEAFVKRFGAIHVLPVAPRAGTAATRILIRGIKGSRAPLTLMAPLVLHGEEGGAFRPDIDAIFRGEARLVW